MNSREIPNKSRRNRPHRRDGEHESTLRDSRQAGRPAARSPRDSLADIGATTEETDE
jgi:hypothetical protein